MNENKAAATRFNSIDSVVGSWWYYNLLAYLSRSMQELYKVFRNVIREPTGRNGRTLATAKWTCSMLILRYSNYQEKAREVIAENYDLHSD